VRRFIRETLQTWGAEAYDWGANQTVSELATNAVLHARTAFIVALLLDDNGLTIRVTDTSPRTPVLRHFGKEATTGRGLALVAQMSEQWGVETESAAKTVWCRLRPADTQNESVDADALTDIDLDALLDEFDAEGGEVIVPSAEARAA
jgi:anti-sigma regulatory factor (Ser/Thr protein kinase)